MTAQQVAPTSIRPVPKPRRRSSARVGGLAAYRLAEAQGHAFRDIAADLDAADANDTADQIDARRDEHIRQALRLVRLARHDRANAESYLALADGHMAEAIRTDRIHDQHRRRGRRLIAASIQAGRDVVGVHEELLSGTVATDDQRAEMAGDAVCELLVGEDDGPADLTLAWPLDARAEP